MKINGNSPPSQNGYGFFLCGTARVATAFVTTGDSDILNFEVVYDDPCNPSSEYKLERGEKGAIGTDVVRGDYRKISGEDGWDGAGLPENECL